MAKRKTARSSLVRSAEPLYQEIRAILESARAGAYRAVNAAMVQAYWNVGRLIVEHEQGGLKRAAYGEAVLEHLSRRRTADFGRGFDPSNLRYMRLFFQRFSTRDAVRHRLPLRGIRDAPRHNSSVTDASGELRPELSWTHYRLLLGVEGAQARDWYMNEAADQHWSTRQLDRQISVLYYDRLLASRKKAPVRKEAAAKLASVEPEQFIRDPYVLEFLDLKDYPARVFDAHARPKDDNPTIGLILCSKKNEAVARYSVLSEGRQIFAARYMKVLPTESQLAREIERERRAIDARRVGKEVR